MLNPELFTKIDLITPLRLSPKTFIHRKDENYFVIGLYDCEEARTFIKHLISAIYSFTEPTAPGDLMQIWPPDTLEDLLNIIICLRNEKILLPEEEYKEIITELSPKSTIEEKEYLNDKSLSNFFTEAIKIIPDNANVLTIGSKGAGFIPIEVSKENVIRSVATISDMPNTLLARKKAQENNLSNVEFLFSKNQDLSPICYAEKFNVCITELFSSGIFDEGILETAISAKQNLLAPDCIFIPAKLNLKIFAYESKVHRDLVQEAKEFDILYGFNFEPFREALSKHIVGVFCNLNSNEIIKISEDTTIRTFDFSTIQNACFNEIFEITIIQSAKLCGFCVYFELEQTPQLKVSNSPFAEKTRYIQRIYTPSTSIYAKEGTVVKLKVSYDGNFKLYFA